MKGRKKMLLTIDQFTKAVLLCLSTFVIPCIWLYIATCQFRKKVKLAERQKEKENQLWGNEQDALQADIDAKTYYDNMERYTPNVKFETFLEERKKIRDSFPTTLVSKKTYQAMTHEEKIAYQEKLDKLSRL